jgi:hypothetical protein
MSQQEHMRLLQEAMNSHKHAQAVASENGRLLELLASRHGTLKRLQQLSLASAALASSVDSSAGQTEPSSLQCLAKLGQSSAVVPVEEEKVEDTSKLIAGKYLNQLLAVVVNGIQESEGEPNIATLLQLEQSLGQSFAFAEEKELIPTTDENHSWKKGLKAHAPLLAILKETAGAGGGGDGEGEGDDE